MARTPLSPRSFTDDDASCSFCQASFTLHERDLNTLCPTCFTRISDHSMFCHSCATPIAPLPDESTLTKNKCPVCGEGELLRSRQLRTGQQNDPLGGLPLGLLECDRCAGLWVSADVFRHLEVVAHRASLPAPTVEAPKPKIPLSGTIGESPGPLYRACVECQQLMLRRNYGRRSGVLIDVCAEHGVWFDDGELSATIDWIRTGRHQRHTETSGAVPGTFYGGWLPPRRVATSHGSNPSGEGFLLVEVLFEAAAFILEVFH